MCMTKYPHSYGSFTFLDYIYIQQHLCFVNIEPRQDLDKELSVENLSEIYQAVHGAISQWFDLGVMLNLKTETLEHLYKEESKNPSYCLHKVLRDWLTSPGTKTRRVLAETLGSEVVARPDLKKKILSD